MKLAYLLGVSNPSPLKTCPRCPPQAVQTISVRSLPKDRSSCRETAPGKANGIWSEYFLPETHKTCLPSKNAGQPHPLFNEDQRLVLCFHDWIIYVNIHRTWWYSYKWVCRTLCKSRNQLRSAYCTLPFPEAQYLSGGGSGTTITKWLNFCAQPISYNDFFNLFWRENGPPFGFRFIAHTAWCSCGLI